MNHLSQSSQWGGVFHEKSRLKVYNTLYKNKSTFSQHLLTTGVSENLENVENESF